MQVDPVSGDTSWTYGLELCLASGTTPAILESVSPTSTVGGGFRFLGEGLRTFVLTQTHRPIISVGSWPPLHDVVPDAIQPVSGFAVFTPCEQGGKGAYTELLIGLGRVGTEGGGWRGLEIGYRAGGRHRVLTLDHDLEICGSTVSCEVTNNLPPSSVQSVVVGRL
jgi:hypothetical protein